MKRFSISEPVLTSLGSAVIFAVIGMFTLNTINEAAFPTPFVLIRIFLVLTFGFLSGFLFLRAFLLFLSGKTELEASESIIVSLLLIGMFGFLALLF